MPNIGAIAAQQNRIRELSPGGHPALARLRPGDALEAEVFLTEQGQTALQLPDGTQVSVSSGQELSAGQTLYLTVTGRMAGSVTVELSDTPAPQASARAALQSQGIEPSPVNLRLAQALQDAGISVTKEAVRTIGEALSLHPTLSPEQAVFMTENKMPMTPRNVAAFQAFARQEAVIGSTLGKLMTVLAKLEPPPAQPQGSAQAQTQAVPPQDSAQAQTQTVQAQTVLQQSSAEPPAAGPAQAPPGQTVPEPAQPAQTPQASQPEKTPHSGQAPAQAAPATPAGEAPQPQQTAQAPHSGQAPAPPQAAPPQAPAAPPQTASAPLVSQEAPAPQTQAPPQTESVSAQAPPGQSGQPAPQAAGTAGPSTETAQTHAPSPAGVPPGEPAQAGAKPPPSLLERVEHLFRKVDRDRAGVLPRELDAPALMRELTEVLHGLEEKASALSGPARESLQQVARELESGVKFMSQLNNFTAFVQLPVTLNGERTSADLYVFNDSKGKKKIDPENATLFLSLGTVNAGRVETFVKVIGKNVECDFYTGTEEVSALVRGEMQNLLKLLSAQGFKLQRTASGLQREASDVLRVKQGHDALAAKYRFSALA